MSSAGNLKCRFFWERIGEDYLLYDRDRGAGCFGENYIATARDGVVAEMMCERMNRPEVGSPRLFDGRSPANLTARLLG